MIHLNQNINFASMKSGGPSEIDEIRQLREISMAIQWKPIRGLTF
jgi:hypothetical protein